MKKLCAAVDRFAMNHPRFGIPNLMKYIVIGNILVYLLTVFAGYEAVSFLGFSWEAITHGEIWRLVTFIFMPGYTSQGEILWLALFLYLYYMTASMQLLIYNPREISKLTSSLEEVYGLVKGIWETMMLYKQKTPRTI